MFLIFIFIFVLTPAHSLPFVVFHGIHNECKSDDLRNFTDNLIQWSGSPGYCIEIGNGVKDSWTMPLLSQAEIACEKVKNMTQLSQGYNIVGISQGNMVARGLIEFCDGPPVKNYTSLAGPHAGVASIPFCDGVLAELCAYIESRIYEPSIQAHLAPSGYFKRSTDIAAYLEGCSFLPKLNNEVTLNTTFKERFSSLHTLVLIMFEEDEVLIPKETSFFGYYPDGASSPVLPPQETKLYTEDWIGLRSLNEAGKVKFFNVSGNHVNITDNDMKKYVVPYLMEDAAPVMLLTTQSSSPE